MIQLFLVNLKKKTKTKKQTLRTFAKKKKKMDTVPRYECLVHENT